MKLKQLTKKSSNGEITLVKKNIDFDMFSPVISRVITEAIEQLAMLESKVMNGELIEVPFKIGEKVVCKLNSTKVFANITGYKIVNKEMLIILQSHEVQMEITLKEALMILDPVKKNGITNE